MRRVLGAALLLLAMAALPGRVMAETEVYTFVADYNWREYDGNSLAGRERGPVYGVGLAGIYRIPGPNPLDLKGKAEGYGASHDFDTTESNYSATGGFAGFTLEGDAGVPLRLMGGSTFEPFAGLGYRYWGRQSEFNETWWNFYGKTGARVTHRMAGSPIILFAEGGARMSFSSRVTFDLNSYGYGDVSVRPGNRVSAFAETGIKFNILKASLFYEGLRFSSSPEHILDSSGNHVVTIRQSHTDADIIGLRLGVSF